MNDSDSHVQRYIEKIVLQKIELESKKIKVDGVTFNFDGYSEEDSVIAEVYSGIKILKSAQRQKLSQDILKMILYEKMVKKKFKKKIVVIDEKIFETLKSEKPNSWKKMAFNKFEIEVEYVKISDEDYQKIVEAKELQGRRFRNK